MFGIDVILVGVWIYLVWMVWKKKTVSRYLKALKTFLLVAGISGMMLITFLIGVVLYNAVYGLDGINEMYDAIAHYIGFSLLGMFYSDYWRLGYISQRTTKNNIQEYRNKYNLTFRSIQFFQYGALPNPLSLSSTVYKPRAPANDN